MNEEIKDILDFTKKDALKNGADQLDIILNRGKSLSISAQNSDVDKYKISGSQVLGIRVIKDSKVGISYTEKLDKESLITANKIAIENAVNSETSNHERIQNTSKKSILSIRDKDPEQIDIGEKVNLALKLESEVKKKSDIVQAVPYNGFSEVESESYYLNSFDNFTFDNEYYLSCYTSALLSKNGVNSMHYHGVMNKEFHKLDIAECVDESITHARNWLEADAVTTGSYDIVFTNDALSSIFHCFSNIFSAKAAMDKQNPFSEKLNNIVTDERLTIIDIPDYKDAFFSFDFDSEGFERKPLNLVSNGVLENFYHNSATSAFFETQNTFHGSRGPRSSLGVSGTNIIIQPGDSTDEQTQTGEYLEIHSLQGLHSGANPISGQFSFGASGYLCRDGKREKAIKEITVAGNFHDMLTNISMISNDLKSDSNYSFFCPIIKFKNLKVAGK